MYRSSSPLVSVVIPTHNRPQFLPRAVESVLRCAGDDVEVLVVPNGPDTSWQESLAPFSHDQRVTVSPIEAPQGNVARNHGMSLARGEYIRFLDDDDYLLPPSAQQVSLLDSSGADMCSGLLSSSDDIGTDLGTVRFPETDDFLCAAVSVSGFRLPAANLFRRSAIGSTRWAPDVARAQDYAWMIDLASMREWNWVHLAEKVGVWFQHSNERTSSTQRLTSKQDAIITRLLDLHRSISQSMRGSPQRKQAIAQGLWYYIHRGFPNHPLYWTKVAWHARQMAPHAKPGHELFAKHVFSRMDPLAVEWLLLPARGVSQMISAVREWRGTTEYRRQL